MAMNDQKVGLILDWAAGIGRASGKPGQSWPIALPRRAWRDFCETVGWERGGGGFVGSNKLAVCYHVLRRLAPAERETWRERTIGDLLRSSSGEPLGYAPPLAVYPKPLGEGRSSFVRNRVAASSQGKG